MACTCGLPLALSRSHYAFLITRPVLASSLRPRPAKPGVRTAGYRSQSLGGDVPLRKLMAGQYSAGQLSLSRRVTLTKCSAARGGEESTESKPQPTVPEESEPQWMDAASKHLQRYLQLARIDEHWLFEPWYLFMWPFYWGAAFAAENGTLPDWRIFAVFTLAGAVLCGTACTVNDLFDKDFDAKVERTKLRPLATGEISPSEGWTFVGVEVLFYVAILSQLEAFRLSSQFQVQVTIQLILNIIYPLSKRWTYWTPAILGLAINWAVFVGWAAVRGTLNLEPSALVPTALFFAAWCWVMVFETIYAHQDIKDDVEAGMKSLAILLGDDTKLWLAGFGSTFVVSLGIVGHMAAIGWPYYASVVLTAAHLGWQIATVDLKNPSDCKEKFLTNVWVGAIVFVGIACGKLLG